MGTWCQEIPFFKYHIHQNTFIFKFSPIKLRILKIICDYIQSSYFFTQLHATQFIFLNGSQRNYQLYVTLRFHIDINGLLTSKTSQVILLSYWKDMRYSLAFKNIRKEIILEPTTLDKSQWNLPCADGQLQSSKKQKATEQTWDIKPDLGVGVGVIFRHPALFKKRNKHHFPRTLNF